MSLVLDASLTLTWSAPYSGGALITGYKIDMQTGGSGAFSNFVANTSSTSTSYSVTGLTAATIYAFHVRFHGNADASSGCVAESATREGDE